MITKKCKYCGKKFKIYTCRKKTAKFCSISCSSKWKNKNNLNIGYKKGHKVLSTWGFQKGNQYGKRNIGNNYGHANKGRKIPWTKTQKNREKHRKLMLGKNNPNWQNGISFEIYPQEFNKKLKEQIRKRDNYICQKCGKTEKKEINNLRKKLSIHHIDYNKKNCNPTNLITLCNDCNIKVNANRKYWTIFFQAILSSRNLLN